MEEPFNKVLKKFGIPHILISNHIPQNKGVINKSQLHPNINLANVSQVNPASWDKLPQAVILCNNN